MDTLQQALFRAMLNNGWFTDSDGDVESPTGYFGYVVNERGDWNGVFDAFSDTLVAYGIENLPGGNIQTWLSQNFYGVWSAMINSNGIIQIHRHGDYVRTPGVAALGLELTGPVRGAQCWFNAQSKRYGKWMDSGE